MKNPKNMVKTYSLGGEDIIVEKIFEIIGIKNKYCIELGACSNYRHSNTKRFIDQGWKSLLIDKHNKGNLEVKSEFITAENINQLFKKYNVPKEVDFMSIDIDGNDYWIWKAIKINPRIVCIEYNPNFALGERKAIQYDSNFIYDGTKYYGASMTAMIELGRSKGYIPLYEVDRNNIIFVLKDEIKDNMDFPEFRISYLFTSKKEIDFLPHECHNPTTKEFIEV